MSWIRTVGLILLCAALLAAPIGCSTNEQQDDGAGPTYTSDSIPPSSPSNLARTTPLNDSRPAFRWDAAVDEGSGIDHYLLNLDGGGWVNIGNVTSYTPSSALPDGSHTLEVRAVDKAGNEGPSCRLDFLCGAVSLNISDVSESNITASGVSLLWTTDKPATSQVEYGLTTGYGLTSTLGTSLVTTHTVHLTGLTADTAYHYRVKSKDASNNEAMSADDFFITLPSPATDAPIITGVGYTNTTTSGVTIYWTTNEPATSQVEYGLTTGYGSASTLDTALVTAHSVALIGLAPGTTYHYRVKSMDSGANQGVSGDFIFTTAVPPDTSPPIISGVGSSNITTSTATIYWTTDEPATSQVEYGLTSSYGWTTTLDASLVTSHSIGLTGLSANATYHFRVKSKDGSGNERVSIDFSFSTPDTLPPTISGVSASGVAAHGATITWATNEASTSQVSYGLTTTCELSTVLDASLVFSHSVVLGGLSAQTTYYLRVRSTDASGNEAVSDLFYFVTAPCPDLGNWIDTYYYCYGELPVVPPWMGPLIMGYYDGMQVYQGMTVLVASVQFWNSLMPSQQEQVLQLIDWLGESREDYVWMIYHLGPP